MREAGPPPVSPPANASGCTTPAGRFGRKTMQTTATRPAPPEMPRLCGSASGLRVTPRRKVPGPDAEAQDDGDAEDDEGEDDEEQAPVKGARPRPSHLSRDRCFLHRRLSLSAGRREDGRGEQLRQLVPDLAHPRPRRLG